MVKKLMESIREQKKNSILAMVTISGEVVFEVIIPLLMANLIDYGIDMGDMGYIVKMGIVLLLSALGQLFCGAISGKFAAIASSGFARNLRHDMFYKVQNYSFSNIDKFSTASIVTRLTTDVTNLQNTYQMIIRMAIRSPLMAIFSLVAAFGIDAKLSLIFLAIIPVLILGLYFIMTRTHPIFERVFRTYDKLNSVVQENLHGIRVVKSFVREDHENKKFTGISENIYKDFKKAEQQLAWNAPLMQLCMYAAVLLLSWFGARTIVACGGDAATGLSTGELLSLLSYATQILMSLMGLSMIFVMLTMSRTSGERVVELLNETPDITTPENAVKSVPDGSIDFEHVQFSYRHGTEGKPVLSDINLHIPAGATVGVIGGTGSSKSSFVQLIPRLYDVDLGAVKVGGIDVRKYDLDTLRGDVAMVLQKNVLFSGTIKDNLRWGNPNATDAEMEEACRLSQADEFIQLFPVFLVVLYNGNMQKGAPSFPADCSVFIIPNFHTRINRPLPAKREEKCEKAAPRPEKQPRGAAFAGRRWKGNRAGEGGISPPGADRRRGWCGLHGAGRARRRPGSTAPWQPPPAPWRPRAG